jgi:hypothetical protein
MKIGFDLDNTICITEDFKFGYDNDDIVNKIYKNCKPNQEIINIVKTIKKQGHEVFVWTSRDERFRKITIDWLKEHDVPYDVLVMNKLYLDIYIGDECINASNSSKIII